MSPAVQILLKYPVKKVNDGVRKSIDNLNLANVVKARSDREEMLCKPKLSNQAVNDIQNTRSNECKLLHLGKNAASCETVTATQDRGLEVSGSSITVSGECSAAVREEKAHGIIDVIRKRRDNKTESLKSDLTDGDSSKWEKKVEGYDGDI